MIQDRNIHRDARALRKSVTIPLIAPAFGTDQDEPQYVTQPRYNWRLSDLAAQFQALTTASVIVKAQAVPGGAAVGSPQLGQVAGPEFSVEEFWRKAGAGSSFINVAAVALAEFSPGEEFTVLDGFWGVTLVVVDQSSGLFTVSNSPIQAFATEEIALANCPQVRPPANESPVFIGRVAILTINAVGGDFIAGTTNTNAGLVAAFNTGPQDGHVLTMNPNTEPEWFNATLGQQLKDASGTNILQGKGGDNATPGDSLVISVRSDGAPVLTGVVATVDYRPWPAGGEGVGDASVSQNRPSFVP